MWYISSTNVRMWLCTSNPRFTLITIILSAASIIIDNLSNILCGYAIAGDVVRFINGIPCTSSTRPNFICCDDDINIVSVLAPVAVEFVVFNVPSSVVLLLGVFVFVLLLCLVFLFCNVCPCLCFVFPILLGGTNTHLFDFNLMLYLCGVGLCMYYE